MIISIIAVVVALFAMLASYFLVNAQKVGVAAKFTLLESVPEKLKVDFEALKVEFSRLEFENYTKLAKKVTQLEHDLESATTKIQEIRESQQNFYQKWARKLGDSLKQEPTPELPAAPAGELPQLPEGFALEPGEKATNIIQPPKRFFGM